MEVVVLVAAAGGLDDGVGGIHGTLSPPPSDVVLIMSLPHGGHNMCALVGAVHTAEEPITVRATDTPTTIHNTGPPLIGWRMGADGRRLPTLPIFPASCHLFLINVWVCTCRKLS